MQYGDKFSAVMPDGWVTTAIDILRLMHIKDLFDIKPFVEE
jgi:hypothetical protein